MAKSTKGTAKKKPAPKTKKKAAPAPPPETAEPKRPMRREIGGIGLLALAVLFTVDLFGLGGAVTRGLSDIIKGLIGCGYFILPVALLIGGVTLLRHKGLPIRFRVFSALILPVLMAAIWDLFGFVNNSANSALRELIPTLFRKGQSFQSGGVLGGLISLFTREFFKLFLNAQIGGILSCVVFAGLFLFFLIKAVNFNTLAAYGKIKERAAVPYDPADYEQDEPAVQEPIVREKRVDRPARVPDPRIATAPAPRPRSYSPDIPIGEEGEALPVGQLEDYPDQSFPTRPTKAKVHRKTEETPSAPADGTVVSAKGESLSAHDIGGEWKEYRRAGQKNPTPVKVSPTVPVAAEISDPPKTERVKRAEPEKKKDSPAQPIKAESDASDEYIFPPLELLNEGVTSAGDARDEVALNRERLENAIRSFGISASFVGEIRGPTVTRYDFELDQGVKLARVTNLAGDLALALGVVNVRIAPIPEKISTVGIEVPNKLVSTVYLRSILESQRFASAKSRLSFAVGKDIGGDCIVGNIAKLPHMLIAGTTGSGKSVCMNSLILSLLYKARPDEVKFIMIDPKMVELGIYSGIPHMLTPVVTEPKKAAGALQWAVVEMLKRYRLFSESGVRDLESYNRHCEITGEDRLPQVVVVIDELADLMMIAAKEVEESICRVAQMGRAAGMHLVVATQRPSADVITGLMKANIPSRIAFAVSSAMESRIILDQSGAEKLIGMGDMLYSPLGSGKPTRVQGAFVSDEERERVIDFIKENNPDVKHETNQEIGEYMSRAEQGKDGGKGKDSEEESASPAGDYDEMLPQAVEAILETKQCSVSMLQRRVKLGYSRAARIVDQMEELGIVGPYEGAKPRSVLVDREGWLEIQRQLGMASDSDLALAQEMSEEEDY